MDPCSQAKVQNYSGKLEDSNMHINDALYSTSAIITDTPTLKSWPLMISKNISFRVTKQAMKVT